MLYIFKILKFLSDAVTIYSILCVIRILMTWIPSRSYTRRGNFLETICDPYLRIFSGIRWLRFGAIDCSPILALAILSMLSYMLNSLAATGRITLGFFLAILLKTAWSVVASLLSFLLLLVLVRIVVFFMGADRRSSIWAQFDSGLSPFIYSVVKRFSGGKPVSYKNALIIAGLTFFVMRIGGGIAINRIAEFLAALPF